MPNELASAAMWIDASADVEAEQHRHQLVAAKVGLSGTWPFLAAATDADDFSNRLALMREAIEDTTPPEVLGEVVASLRNDWQILNEDRKSALSVTASGPIPSSYIHVQDKGDYWQVDRIHSASHIETITRTASQDDAYEHANKGVPVFVNGQYVGGGRLHHVASTEEFYDQGREKWVRLGGAYHVVHGRGLAEYPEDPDNYEDGLRDAHLHANQGYDYSNDEDFADESDGYKAGYQNAKGGNSKKSVYTPDPDAGWRYPHYPPPPQEAGHGGAPTASPIPAGAEVGPDGFPPDYGVGEQRTPEAYARQTTPGAWTVTPGTEWRDSYLPNAGTGLAPGQPPSGNPAQPATASRRTAGTESGTSDDFNGSDKPYWKCQACGENNHSYGSQCNGCGENTGTGHELSSDHPVQRTMDRLFEGSRHTADRQDDRAQAFHEWAKENGHNPDDLGSLKLYEKQPGISRAHADDVADIYHGEDTDWRATHRMQQQGSRRTAQEGVAPSTHSPNPNYFSQGTQGLQGPPSFPVDPAPEEPYSNTPVNDLYGAVPPQLSTGSEEGQVDGAGYSRMGARDLPGLGCPHCNDAFYKMQDRAEHIRSQHPGEYSGPTDDMQFLIDRVRETNPDFERHSRLNRDNGHSGSRLGFNSSAQKRRPVRKFSAEEEGPTFPGTPSGNGQERYQQEYLRHVPGDWDNGEGVGYGAGYADRRHDLGRMATTNGQIIGHCDHCSRPVRWHDGNENGHLEHLHNGSHKCNDGSNARTSSVIPQFFDPTLVARNRRTASESLAVEPVGAPPAESGPTAGSTASGGSSGPSASGVRPPAGNQGGGAAGAGASAGGQAGAGGGTAGGSATAATASWGSNMHQQGVRDISSHMSAFAAYPPHFQTQALQTITAPTAENPTGRDPDEYKSNTWEGLVNQRPMQSAEDRDINTPVKAAPPIETQQINTPTPGLGDEDSVRSRGDIDGEEEREKD